jgi:hypothetical protein
MMGTPGPDALSEKLLALDDLTHAERDELKIMLRARRAGARFTRFLSDHSTGFFTNEPDEPEHTQVTPKNLTDVAKAIYRARSGYLHAGDPMFLSPIFPDTHWHMNPAVGKIWQNRQFTEEQRLPCVDFFHRLVRHCLLKRIVDLAGKA